MRLIPRCVPPLSCSGFSLVEVLVATGVLATAILTLAQLFAAATNATAHARDTSGAAVLAWQKIEQLRADPGLGPSPPGTLDVDVAGYVDCADGLGESLGGCPAGPSSSRYRRRWSIEPLPGPAGLAMRVRVLGPTGVTMARLVAVRARQAP